MGVPGNRITLLGLSDQIVPLVYSDQVTKNFSTIDLIVGCGDLRPDYLEYVLTALNKPLIYVPGNHDHDDLEVPGGDSVDGRLTRVLDLVVLGFGGSIRYKPQGRHQYTQGEMRVRVLPFLHRLVLRRLIYGHGLDLLISHSPPHGIHDAEDLAHQGFKIFRRLLQWVRPRYMLHGHSHVHPNITITETTFAGSCVMNVFPFRVIDIET